MAGQTNSWMDTIQTTGSPCIGDTMKMSGGSGSDVEDTNGDGESILQYASMWWLVVAIGVGYLLKGRKK